jgi:hypothetical protein
LDKFKNRINKLTIKKESKVSIETPAKILASTKTAQSVLITDLENGTTNTYPSARAAALVLNASNSTIMNKLNAKNTSLFKGRYLITGFKKNLKY